MNARPPRFAATGLGAALPSLVSVALVFVALCAAYGALAASEASAATSAARSGSGSGSEAVTVTGTIGGRSVTGSEESHPLRLSPSGLSTVDLEVVNSSPRAIVARTVVLKGQVIGLTFFDFETSIDLSIRAHERAGVTYDLDLSGLNGEATGLIPGSLSILDSNRNSIGSDPLVTDVRGSIVSVYGLFGLGLLVLTLLALLSTLLSVARHSLPPNRFRRALRFVVPGVGLGLVLVFTLSALRVWLPSSGHWLTIVLAFAAVFFAAGFLSPSPVEEDADDEAEDELDDSDAGGDARAPAGAPTTIRSAALETIVPAPAAEPEPTT